MVTTTVTSAEEQDTGSGLIVRSNGEVLTNAHVIAAADGAGQIVDRDASDDLAVLALSGAGTTGLRAATFASSSTLRGR